MAEVTFDGVHKRYPDGTHAVKNMDAEIGDGEFVVLVGPSGCGKTTALRMLAGLEAVTKGEIRVGGRTINKVKPRDRDVAMVFQSYALYPHLSVGENIGFGLELRGVDKETIDERVQEAAKILGISEHLDRRPRALSGGQRQRVAMGRAMVREPQAFLLDEPLSNLDAKLRVQMRAEVLRIQRELGTTTIYVTHDQTEAMTMGDRVAVMRKGILEQFAPPQELYDRPVNLFVGGFIGSPAMNLVHARIDADDGAHISFGDQRLRIADEVFEDRPALKEADGREVIVGIRPEEMEDASLASDHPDDRRMTATVDLTEAMGSDVYVHFEVDSPPVHTEDTAELAADRGEEEEARTETTTEFVARFHPTTGARPDDRIEIAVDTRRLHFFEAENGHAIFD